MLRAIGPPLGPTVFPNGKTVGRQFGNQNPASDLYSLFDDLIIFERCFHRKHSHVAVLRNMIATIFDALLVFG